MPLAVDSLVTDLIFKANAQIGNFVELKQTVLGEGTKAGHLTYLGDAKIGPKSNVGAGLP